jgi:hypothetical protein
MYWVPGHAGVRWNEIADKLARDCSVQKFVGPEPSLGVRTQNKQRWVDYQHLAVRPGPSDIQRQARKRRHLHVTGLTNCSLYRRCGTEEETSVHILFECEALASLTHANHGSFFLDLEDIGCLSLGVIRNFSKGTELPWPSFILPSTRAYVKTQVHRDRKGSNPTTNLI